MHLESQVVAAPRRRRSYTKQYKAGLVAQCLQPHVSIASIALANGLNANLLRRWVHEHRQSSADGPVANSMPQSTLPDKRAAFIALQPGLNTEFGHQGQSEATPITIELPSHQGLIRLHWPAEHADRLAVCLKVLLR